MNLQSPPETKVPVPDTGRSRRARSGALTMGIMFPVLCFSLAAPAFAQHDCLQWRLVQNGVPNSAHHKLVAAYDSYRGFVVAVDGRGLAQEWNGFAWTRVADAPGMLQCGGLPCLEVAATCDLGGGFLGACTPNPPLWTDSVISIMGTAAFDAHRRVTVVYDTIDIIREWDGQTWAMKQPNPSPGLLSRSQMTYHPVRQTLLMFGGLRPGVGLGLNELWEWDGTAWTPIASAHSPPGRYVHGQAFDESRGVLVVFGGRSSLLSPVTFYGDLWEWDGVDWQQRFPPVGDPSPGIRLEHAMAYDATRKTVVMVGGNDLIADRNDVWDWNGETWRQRSLQPDAGPAGTPDPAILRRRHAAYDTSRQVLHLITELNIDFHWAIEHPTTPEVASGPASQQVVEGNPVAFSVITEPPTTVEFKWRKDGVDIPGANQAGYGISAVTMADQGLYDVVVTRSGHDPFPPCGMVLSPPAALTVSPAIPADLNADGAVDMLDFADFATMFTGPGE